QTSTKAKNQGQPAPAAQNDSRDAPGRALLPIHPTPVRRLALAAHGAGAGERRSDLARAGGSQSFGRAARHAGADQHGVDAGDAVAQNRNRATATRSSRSSRSVAARTESL